MEIPAERLDEFVVLFRKEFGEELTRHEALEKSIVILRLVKLVSIGNEDEKHEGRT